MTTATRSYLRPHLPTVGETVSGYEASLNTASECQNVVSLTSAQREVWHFGVRFQQKERNFLRAEVRHPSEHRERWNVGAGLSLIGDDPDDNGNTNDGPVARNCRRRPLTVRRKSTDWFSTHTIQPDISIIRRTPSAANTPRKIMLSFRQSLSRLQTPVLQGLPVRKPNS